MQAIGSGCKYRWRFACCHSAPAVKPNSWQPVHVPGTGDPCPRGWSPSVTRQHSGTKSAFPVLLLFTASLQTQWSWVSVPSGCCPPHVLWKLPPLPFMDSDPDYEQVAAGGVEWVQVTTSTSCKGQSGLGHSQDPGGQLELRAFMRVLRKQRLSVSMETQFQ